MNWEKIKRGLVNFGKILLYGLSYSLSFLVSSDPYNNQRRRENWNELWKYTRKDDESSQQLLEYELEERERKRQMCVKYPSVSYCTDPVPSF